MEKGVVLNALKQTIADRCRDNGLLASLTTRRVLLEDDLRAIANSPKWFVCQKIDCYTGRTCRRNSPDICPLCEKKFAFFDDKRAKTMLDSQLHLLIVLLVLARNDKPRTNLVQEIRRRGARTHEDLYLRRLLVLSHEVGLLAEPIELDEPEHPEYL